MAAASETQENSQEESPENAAESEVSSNDNSKMKIDDMKVVDLRNELEKRDLDKNGVKSVLIERLKAAIVEEGRFPEEYDFDVSDILKSPAQNKIDTVETNGNVDLSDKLSVQEEKIDVTLQLSIDEEEAQLNEDENLMDLPKQTESDKIDGDIEHENVKTEKKEDPVLDQTPEKVPSPAKSTKSPNDDAKLKKVIKVPSPTKSTEGLKASPKVVKVIGKNDKGKAVSVTGAKCLWVTGIPDTTRAADLKTLFSKQGRVLSVKIVKNAKQKSRCYGFVTMATSKDATKAIQNLHRTELNGKVISVERTQNEPTTLLKKAEAKFLAPSSKKQPVKKEVTTPKKPVSTQNESKTESKETSKEGNKTADNKSVAVGKAAKKKDEKISSAEKDKSKDKERKSRERREVHRPFRRPAGYKPRPFNYDERPSFGTFRRRGVSRRPFPNRIGFGSSFKPRPSLMALQKLREERFQHEHFRERRELELRRADELSRHRYIERKQREEAYRLEREKEKLRIERELLERERAEIIKLEREKQRLERERLEREREELRRQAELRRNAKRPFSRIERETEHLWDERKKSSRYDGHPSFPSETPSSSRFDYASRDRASYGREYERHPDRFATQKHLEALPRAEFSDRDSRREVTIRAREERHVFSRSEFKDRDRRSFSSRERERHSSRREPSRDDWKHDRRVHERIIPSSSTSGHRRMAYY